MPQPKGMGQAPGNVYSDTLCTLKILHRATKFDHTEVDYVCTG